MYHKLICILYALLCGQDFILVKNRCYIPSISYHKEEETLKPTKTQYPFNSKPSFNPNRGVMRESPKLREEAFVCMFCGCAGHLDELCF
jgi:hypothetical protein